MAQPMWRSISTIFSTEEVSRREEVIRFSTPRMTPWEVATPMAVLPSLMASREYSTWKRRPSGEKVLYHLISCWRWGWEWWCVLDAAI